MYGSDQSMSLEEKGFSLLNREIQRIDLILNSSMSEISSQERKVELKLRYFRESDFDWES
jgi:sialic acid synthase SpsE